MNYTRAVSVSRFILVILCIALVLSIAVCGVDSWGLGGIFESGTIRLGLDLSGGSIITYSADTEDTGETLAKGMDGILESMRTRLDAQGLTEANVYLVGYNMITLEIPSITDPNEAVETFGAAAVLTFRDADGNVFLEGKDVVEAEAGYYSSDSGVAQWVVSLELTDEGAEKFAAATKQAAIDQTSIYTYMDDEVISTATVSSEYASEGITGGKAQISGSFDRESASALAGNINAGALQYNLKLEELRAVGPTLGEKSLETSLKAGA
ncbi:MAG: protein translocase subunit SecD, partial [Clostridiales bacterium]|nr:protein translocase subunit SecD [Clostridiales bacterium]